MKPSLMWALVWPNSNVNTMRDLCPRWDVQDVMATRWSTSIKRYSPPRGRYVHDRLLPATSNAVERGNRRYRKMQQHVYRVRTQAQIGARLALDMWREAQREGRHQTLQTLHEARAG